MNTFTAFQKGKPLGEKEAGDAVSGSQPEAQRPDVTALRLQQQRPAASTDQGFHRNLDVNLESSPIVLTFEEGLFVARYVRLDHIPQQIGAFSYPMASIAAMPSVNGAKAAIISAEPDGHAWFKTPGDAAVIKVTGGHALFILTTYKPLGFGPSGMHIEVNKLGS